MPHLLHPTIIVHPLIPLPQMLDIDELTQQVDHLISHLQTTEHSHHLQWIIHPLYHLLLYTIIEAHHLLFTQTTLTLLEIEMIINLLKIDNPEKGLMDIIQIYYKQDQFLLGLDNKVLLLEYLNLLKVQVGQEGNHVGIIYLFHLLKLKLWFDWRI